MYESYIEHCKKYWRGNTSIDRIDVGWNYCKENCKWATRHEQRMNCRDTVIVEIDWKKYKTTDISKITGLSIDGARDRIKAFKKWIIDKWQLLSTEKIKTGRKNVKFVVIWWEKFTSKKIAQYCWIWIRSASQRLNKYLRNEIWECNLLCKKE